MSLLIELRNTVEARGVVTLDDLANRFDRPPDALRGMLRHWVDKGVIRRQAPVSQCGGCAVSARCGSCGVSGESETYAWVT